MPFCSKCKTEYAVNDSPQCPHKDMTLNKKPIATLIAMLVLRVFVTILRLPLYLILYSLLLLLSVVSICLSAVGINLYLSTDNILLFDVFYGERSKSKPKGDYWDNLPKQSE